MPPMIRPFGRYACGYDSGAVPQTKSATLTRMMLQPIVAMIRLRRAACRRMGRKPTRSISHDRPATESPEQTNSKGIGRPVRVASVYPIMPPIIMRSGWAKCTSPVAR